jgi:hypothetical protein
MEPIADALAGASGGVLARLLIYPAEARRTIAAVHGDEAVKTMTVAQHYNGFATAVFDSALYFGLNFGIYSTLKGSLGYSDNRIMPMTTALGVGMLSDLMTMIFDVPVDTLVLRAAATGESMSEAIQSIRDEYGLWGFWRGMECSVYYSPLRQALIFLVFERLKFLATRGKPAGSVASPFQLFFMGAAGEAFATCVIYPMFYAKVKLAGSRKKAKGDEGEDYTGMLDILKKDSAANGIAGLYKGLQQEVFASASKGAVRFLVKEKIRAFWLMTLMQFFAQKK